MLSNERWVKYIWLSYLMWHKIKILQCKVFNDFITKLPYWKFVWITQQWNTTNVFLYKLINLMCLHRSFSHNLYTTVISYMYITISFLEWKPINVYYIPMLWLECIWRMRSHITIINIGLLWENYIVFANRVLSSCLWSRSHADFPVHKRKILPNEKRMSR